MAKKSLPFKKDDIVGVTKEFYDSHFYYTKLGSSNVRLLIKSIGTKRVIFELTDECRTKLDTIWYNRRQSAYIYPKEDCFRAYDGQRYTRYDWNWCQKLVHLDNIGWDTDKNYY